MGPYVFQRGNQDLGLIWDVDSALFRNPAGGLADNIRIDRLCLWVYDKTGDLFDFLPLQEIAVVCFHNAFEFVRNLFVHNDSLLGGTDHAVVKGLGEHQVRAGAL